MLWRTSPSRASWSACQPSRRTALSSCWTRELRAAGHACSLQLAPAMGLHVAVPMQNVSSIFRTLGAWWSCVQVRTASKGSGCGGAATGAGSAVCEWRSSELEGGILPSCCGLFLLLSLVC